MERILQFDSKVYLRKVIETKVENIISRMLPERYEMTSNASETWEQKREPSTSKTFPENVYLTLWFFNGIRRLVSGLVDHDGQTGVASFKISTWRKCHLTAHSVMFMEEHGIFRLEWWCVRRCCWTTFKTSHTKTIVNCLSHYGNWIRGLDARNGLPGCDVNRSRV